jgi:riboflavin transporter FmnP
MNTKTLATIITFVALAAAIDAFVPHIPFPVPLYSYLYYNLWEIPIVALFMLYGLKTAIPVAVLNAFILVVIFPGNLISGPFYNLIAVLSMLIGVFGAYRIATYRCPKENLIPFLKKHEFGLGISMTTLGVTTRIIITTISNYYLIAQTPPIGFGFSHDATIAFLPFSAVFNGTQALFTIPVALATSIAVFSALKIK